MHFEMPPNHALRRTAAGFRAAGANVCSAEICVVKVNDRSWADCGSSTKCRYRPLTAGREWRLPGSPTQGSLLC